MSQKVSGMGQGTLLGQSSLMLQSVMHTVQACMPAALRKISIFAVPNRKQHQS
jgi:hypothetical protein